MGRAHDVLSTQTTRRPQTILGKWTTDETTDDHKTGQYVGGDMERHVAKQQSENNCGMGEREKALRASVRAKDGSLEEIPKDMVTEYESTMAEMLLKYKEIAAPAMPCYGGPKTHLVDSGGKTLPSDPTCHGEVLVIELTENQNAPRSHQERHAMMGDMSEEFMALIHTAIPDAKMYRIPGAKAAMDKEWKKLFDMNAFGLDEVMTVQVVAVLINDATTKEKRPN